MSWGKLQWAYAQSVRPAARKFLLVTIALKCGDNSGVRMSYAGLGAECACGKSTAIQHVNALVADGLVRRVEVRSLSGRQGVNVFDVDVSAGVPLSQIGFATTRPAQREQLAPGVELEIASSNRGPDSVPPEAGGVLSTCAQAVDNFSQGSSNCTPVGSEIWTRSILDQDPIPNLGDKRSGGSCGQLTANGDERLPSKLPKPWFSRIEAAYSQAHGPTIAGELVTAHATQWRLKLADLSPMALAAGLATITPKRQPPQTPHAFRLVCLSKLGGAA